MIKKITFGLFIIFAFSLMLLQAFAASLNIDTALVPPAVSGQTYVALWTVNYSGQYPLKATFSALPGGVTAGGQGTLWYDGIVAENGIAIISAGGIVSQSAGAGVSGYLEVNDGHGLASTQNYSIRIDNKISCEPVRSSVSVNETARVVAYGGYSNYIWEAPDSSSAVPSEATLGMSGTFLDVKYGESGSKHITVRTGDVSATCVLNVVRSSVTPPTTSTFVCTMDKSTVSVGEPVSVYGNQLGVPYTFNFPEAQLLEGGSGTNWAKLVYNSPGVKIATLYTNGQTAQCNITVMATTTGAGITVSDVVPFIRLYSVSSNDHFYTSNRDEAEAAKKFGYKIEGEMGHLLKNWVYGAHAMNRLFNPTTRKHFYTTDGAEAQTAKLHGYNYEGVIGYMAADLKGELGSPLYRMYNPSQRKHFYTTNLEEYNMLVNKGFSGEGSVSGWLVLSFR